MLETLLCESKRIPLMEKATKQSDINRGETRVKGHAFTRWTAHWCCVEICSPLIRISTYQWENLNADQTTTASTSSYY